MSKRKVNRIKRIIRSVPKYISGPANEDTYGIGKIFWSHFIWFMFNKIHEAYAIKAEGGTDELGNTWPPLARSTIANRPIRKGNLKGLGNKNVSISQRKRGLLTPMENKIWKRTFRMMTRKLLGRMESPGKEQFAAAVAWKTVKKLGAKTRIDFLGERKVKIMRDTDRLFDSLEPGFINHFSYKSRNKDQIVERTGTKVVLETKVEYAHFHNATRPVIPDNADEWTDDAIEFGMFKVMDRLKAIA